MGLMREELGTRHGCLNVGITPHSFVDNECVRLVLLCEKGALLSSSKQSLLHLFGVY